MPVLNFKGKSSVYSHHLGVPFRSLKIDEKRSLPKRSKAGKKEMAGREDNLIIHGDNLHALKALLPGYAGKVKCVYIDPPYNTGNEGWKYNDNVNAPFIKEWLRQNGIGSDDMERHDKWLCMMWPRLQLLKELLSDDGVIFVSIDDNEQHHLRMIMNEIFGEQNFIGAVKRRASRKTAHLSRKMSDMCDYILAYSKDGLLAPLGVTPAGDSTRPVFNAGNSVSFRQLPLGADARCKDGLYKKGVYHASSMQFKLLDDLKIKNGKTVKMVGVEGRFRVSQDILNQTIYITQNFGLRRYVRPEEKNKIKTLHDLVDNKDFYNEVGSEQLKGIFSKDKVFQSPKPSRLIKFLLKAQENGLKSNSYIVLDSFAGSGTTAHAVLDLNREDGGNRKFILIECEDYADKITAERVRRVIKGASKAKDESLKKGMGGSFAYCALGGEINEENLIKGKSLPSYKALSSHVYYMAVGRPLDKSPDKPGGKLNESEDFYIGKSPKGAAFFVIYKPSLKFLRSRESALNFDRKEKIQKINEAKKLQKSHSVCPCPLF